MCVGFFAPWHAQYWVLQRCDTRAGGWSSDMRKPASQVTGAINGVHTCCDQGSAGIMAASERVAVVGSEYVSWHTRTLAAGRGPAGAGGHATLAPAFRRAQVWC